MISKEQIDLIFLNMIKKCNDEQEKQMYRAVYYDIVDIYNEYKIHEKHFESQIKHYKYFKTQPLINALNKNIENLQKEKGELIQELEKAKRERDRYRNKWGRVKNVIQKEGWQLDLIEKAYKHLIHMDRIFDDVEDSRNNFMEIRKEFEAVLEERK